MGRWKTAGHKEISHLRIGFLKCRGGFLVWDRLSWGTRALQRGALRTYKGTPSKGFQTHDGKWKAERCKSTGTAGGFSALPSGTELQDKISLNIEDEWNQPTRLHWHTFKKSLLTHNIHNPSGVPRIVTHV